MRVKEPRLIQVFLSQTNTPGPSIYEVSSDEDNNLFCTCPGFRGRRVCKHTKYVKAKIDTNGGVYPLEISNRATEEEANKARKSNAAFRDFIIKYGKIEVV